MGDVAIIADEQALNYEIKKGIRFFLADRVSLSFRRAIFHRQSFGQLRIVVELF